MLKSIAKLLGGSNDKVIKDLQRDVDDINAIEPEFQALSDEQLKAKTQEFKSRLNSGEAPDDLLPEAFATVREAAKRVIGMRHFDVQLMGGIILHEGKIAEMRTGEGKTLVATLPTYLNALTGKGVHVITVNDYLARRDAQWMGAVYDFLGLSTGILQHDGAFMYNPDLVQNEEADSNEAQKPQPGFEKLSPAKRHEAYRADITYGTNNEYGFDYLRDNMVVDASQRVQKDRTYAIVDEVDNILIDEARTPLIISGPAQESPQDYVRFARLVPMLKEGEDYTIDLKHKSIALTTDGTARVESALKVKNLYDVSNYGLVQFLDNALKANIIFHRDSDYVVKDGEVIIVDEFTGRLMPGRRFSEGLHQALEAKEGVKVQRESITYATITLQNYFRLYEKLGGMTGTALTEAEEFWKIYKLDVVEVPTNKPMVRDDRRDHIYMNTKGKWKAVADEIEELQKTGQPTLVGTTDIAKSEHLSELLNRRGVRHEVLNAKNHAREAHIVAQAGRLGAVTVATNMAGRGTDIILGGSPDLAASKEEWQKEHDKVLELGGLHIIGTERHEARRVDNQLRGRAGRQGDPGSSRFYMALDDDLVKRFGGERIQSVMSWTGIDENTAIENGMISKSIESAQVKVEAFHFDMRKHLVDYDDIVNKHRDVIYSERNKVLSGADLKANVESMIEKELLQTLGNYVTGAPENWDTETMVKELGTILSLPPELSDPDGLAEMSAEEIEEDLLAHATALYEEREAKFGSELTRTIERQVMLRVIDSHWVQHLTSMENLRTGIGLHAYGQRDPLVAYKTEGHKQFQELLGRIQHDIAYTIYNIQVNPGAKSAQNAPAQPNGGPNGAPRMAAGKGSAVKIGGESVMAKVVGDRNKEAVAAGGRKIGRNELCPCGSNKKYKRCHGAAS
ncbi:MAG: preprotein translocase subunit SecA [Chloroflexi bacterium]|nr:preprotein translocase subunit SecA [Chloroflexota bacterium]